MFLKFALKILLIGVLLYGGWYVFSFISAWGGIAIIVALLLVIGVNVEKELKNINK